MIKDEEKGYSIVLPPNPKITMTNSPQKKIPKVQILSPLDHMKIKIDTIANPLKNLATKSIFIYH